MRAYIIATSLALSVIGNASGKVVDTGADAQRYCQPLIEGSFHDYDEARSAGSCEGMVETTMAFSPNLPADVRKVAFWKASRSCCGTSTRIRIDWTSLRLPLLSKHSEMRGRAMATMPRHQADLGLDQKCARRKNQNNRPIGG
jgi:hypothetical protein